MTAQTVTTEEPDTFLASHVQAAAKAIALQDGWTELDWNMLPARYSKKYYEMARAGLAAAHPELLTVVKKQQSKLDAVDRLSQGFVSKPSNALDSIEQPGFGRGVRAAGREIRAVLDASEKP